METVLAAAALLARWLRENVGIALIRHRVGTGRSGRSQIAAFTDDVENAATYAIVRTTNLRPTRLFARKLSRGSYNGFKRRLPDQQRQDQRHAGHHRLAQAKGSTD
jgi:hypothetical protein